MLQKLNTKRGGFTLVEIMIVVAIIALLAAIAVPNFLRSRKRSQATQILEDLRIIDNARDQYFIENNKPPTVVLGWAEVVPYLKQGTRLYQAIVSTGNASAADILGNDYGFNGTVNTVSPTTFAALSDVAPASFWSPFQ
jgi:prepilin-type N-terminal cleavage/methylation domain-containing protein